MNRRPDEPVCDADLVRRAQQGDNAAFEALALRYQDRLYNLCYRMLGNDADAQDVTQAALIKAYQALGRFEARAGFYTWMYRITMNLAISTRRSRRRPMLTLHRPDPDQPDCEPAAEGTDVSRSAETSELHAKLTAALERLDDDFRAAVVLKDVEELDYATIGEILGVPVGTVKSRIHRGRMMLRAMLEGDQEEDRDALRA
ncbi:MAG: sigma-70 family RNA polymerase sigma factor [Phycisphaerales bacterium]|nr:sigma-70 family RNA polymerase sigma factor [Phycisphaerales bacterium]